jgi:hypothetical protein
MSKSAKAAPSEAIARHLAGKGEAAVEQWQAVVDRAREMLASGEVRPPVDGIDPHRPPPYPWETTERRLDTPRRVWLGYVNDYATGEGSSVYFGAGFARDEDEFRRRLSLELGRELANLAKVGEGADSLPFASVYLSPSFRSRLDAFDRGEDRPAAMSFLARFRANYS